MRWTHWVVTSMVISGCSRELTSSTAAAFTTTPTIPGCTQDPTFSLGGAALFPLVVNALGDAGLEFPSLTLQRERDEAGNVTEPIELIAHPVGSTTNQQFALDEPPPAGRYGLSVTSTEGRTARQPAALTFLPPPEILGLSQSFACRQGTSNLKLQVAHFAPGRSVSINGQPQFPQSIVACTSPPPGVVPGTCAEITVALNGQGQPSSLMRVQVGDGACASQPRTVAWLPTPSVSAITPDSVCRGSATQEIVIKGEGFLSVDGATPSVEVGHVTLATTVSDCVELTPLVRECQTLRFQLQTSALAEGSSWVTVRNPTPADCGASLPVYLTLNPSVTITSVTPTALCTGDGQLTLNGSGFSAATRAQLNGVPARHLALSNGNSTLTATFDHPVPGPGRLEVDNGPGCNTSSTINVLAGPTIELVDTQIVEATLRTRVSVVTTGVTGTPSFSLVPVGGTSATAVVATPSVGPGAFDLIVPPLSNATSYDLLLSTGSGCGARAHGAVLVTGQSSGLLVPTPAGAIAGARTTVSLESTRLLQRPRVYLAPNPPSTAAALSLGAVTVLTNARLRVTLPSTIPAGNWTFMAVSTDGSTSSSPTFRVVSDAAPVISAVTPRTALASNGQRITLMGHGFRQPNVTLACANQAGVPSSPPTSVESASSTLVTFRADLVLDGGACRATVLNDDGTSVTSESFEVHAPAQELGPVRNTALAAPHRSPVTLTTEHEEALYVIGGHSFLSPLDTVESAMLDPFGAPGPFTLQPLRLQQARTRAAGATIGRFLYVVGGHDGSAPLDTVERASVLDPEDRAELESARLAPHSGGLDAGTWTYRVSVVRAPSDPINPDGEDLPSDPWPVDVPDLGPQRTAVTLSWKSEPTAAKYRVYRSQAPNAVTDTEALIAELPAGQTSLVDANRPSLTVPPRRPGALGAWQVLPTRLSVPREGPGVAWALDPLDATTAYLYVAGGRSGPNTVQDSIEVLPISLGAGGAQTPAAAFVTSATRLTEARWMFGASPASQPTSSNLPAGTTWLYLLSGLGTGGGVSSVCEASEVLPGGALGAPAPLSPLGRTSVGHLLIDNRVRVFGGTPVPSTLISRADLCGPGTSGCGAMVQAPSLSPWSTPASEVMGLARVETGVARAGAQVYVVGGAFAAPTGTLLDTTVVEYRTW